MANPTGSKEDSVREQLLRPIIELQTLSQTLFSSLSNNQVPPDPPVAALAACDDAIAVAIRLARTHVIKQRRIEALMDEVEQLDVQLINIVQNLGKGQQELQAIIQEGEERLHNADVAKTFAVPYPNLISYGARLADYTAAPPGIPADDAAYPHQRFAFHPPFPASEIMQTGRLGEQEPIGPLGETQAVGDALKPPPDEPGSSIQARPRATRDPTTRAGRRRPAADLFDLDLNPEMN